MPGEGLHKESYTLYVIGEYNKLGIQVNSLINEIIHYQEVQNKFLEK